MVNYKKMQASMRVFLLSCLVFFCCHCVAMPAFAAEEVYAIQVGTVYYEATATGAKASDTIIAKETITYLFADASVVQVGREEERFIGCTNLKVIDFSTASSLRIIYSETFKNCTSLTTVILPSGLTEIQSGAFRGCTALQSIALSGTSLTSISNHTFNGCTALQSVSFPAALTQIDYYAFYGCTGLVLGTSLQSTALKTIQNHAFYGCTSLVSVSMPSTLTTLESNAFAQCVNFTTLSLGTTPPTATTDTFANCAQSVILQIDAGAISTYQAVNDGSTTDLYWYGWLLQQIDVTDQLTLTATGWEYQAGGAPTVSLAKNGVALTSDVTYLYATAQDGTYQALDALPHSNAGELEAGEYWCMAVYDAARECGSVIASFTVTQRPITATIWVGGITKTYDGTTTIVGLQPTVVMEGGLSGDDVSATGTFAYANASAGSGKTIQASDLALTGADAANYILSATVASTNGAVITQKSITIPPPTASDINKGDTLDDSTLTEGDMSDVEITGHWEWVDSTTTPEESGYFPTIFIPDDANYATYGPVDVWVIVHDDTTLGTGDTDGLGSGEDAADGTGDDTADGEDDATTGGLLSGIVSAIESLFGGAAGDEDLTADGASSAGDSADLTDLEAGDIPLASALATGDAWALVNLLLCIETIATCIVLAAQYFYRRQSGVIFRAQGAGGFVTSEEDLQGGRHLRLLSVVPALLSLACFLLTEDLSTPMCFVDKWTLPMLLFALLQLALIIYTRKRAGDFASDYGDVFEGDAFLDGD